MDSSVILFVENNRDYREGLAAVLRSQGFVVREASDTVQAFAQLNCGPLPDIILTSLRIPYIDRLVFCRKLSADHLYRNIPVIVVSAVVVEMIQDDMIQDGLFSTSEFGERVVLTALLNAIKHPR
jgi:two-component system, chemotaxis family, chemotaxis protein CheY